MLMIGSLLHGVGNWQDIKNDDSLGLYFDLVFFLPLNQTKHIDLKHRFVGVVNEMTGIQTSAPRLSQLKRFILFNLN